MERQRVDLFQSTGRLLSCAAEHGALTDYIAGLMVPRHCGVPTPLSDWSTLPWVATYSAVQGDDEDDGELWGFDEALCEQEEKAIDAMARTTSDGSGDASAAGLTAFSLEKPRDWFICGCCSGSTTLKLARKV
jgi:hypothetical protein